MGLTIFPQNVTFITYIGNTAGGEAPERCPICGAPRGKFKKIE
ncbi:MAG: rubrerythrin family protein [Dehalococcoidales bacterium]|nr:rubrerythrin family protein [Dehalococcoidales bacterium]